MTYELINSATTNSIAAFENEADAVAALQQIAADNNELARQRVVVAFDAGGEAVGSRLGSDLVGAV